MILAQLDTTATDAFLRFRAHAFSGEPTMHEVAHDVANRRIDFRDLPE